MYFGATEPKSLLRRRAPHALRLVLLLGSLVLSAPTYAADKLQEFLGKAQSDAEKKAVNDLVDKLKGVARPKAPEAAAPQSPDQSVSTQSSTSPGTPGLPRDTSTPATPPGGRVATPAPVTPPPAAQTPPSAQTPPPPAVQPTPEAAVESAEKKQAPSVDLEVFFAYNSADIAEQAVTALKTLGQALRDASLADDAFLIAGHTDAKGGATFNMELSQRRAESVRQFLIANFGIDASKLVAKGFGQQRLKTPRRPLAAENRRVQIVNLSKDAQRP